MIPLCNKLNPFKDLVIVASFTALVFPMGAFTPKKAVLAVLEKLLTKMAKQQIEQMALSRTFFIKAGLGEIFFILFLLQVTKFCLFLLKQISIA